MSLIRPEDQAAFAEWCENHRREARRLGHLTGVDPYLLLEVERTYETDALVQGEIRALMEMAP